MSRFRSRYFQATLETLGRLDTDPSWQPLVTPEPAPYDRVLHNLPAADFDDTGLVGRATDVRNVVDMLLKGRDRMITLTGEGGIGKTALALAACYTLVDAQDPPFDAVLWVSLKNERLTAEGVRAITDAVRDIGGATERLGQAMDPSFGGSVEELSDFLSGIRALVVIDNLESAQGTEVVALYDALPESVTFLFTSRVGIGQIERRMPLTGLSERDAVLLLRKFAARLSQTGLARISDEVAQNVTLRLRYSPLAIRWYVLSVEAGKAPTDALRNQTDLLRFCVDNVYEALSPDAKLMLAILRTIDRAISFDELAVISAIEIDTLRRGSQVLSQGSLLVRTPGAEVGDPDLIELSATARAYLPRVDTDTSVMRGVLDRETAYMRDRDDARQVASQRRLDPNVVVVRSREDQPTVHLLRLALRLSKKKDRDGALEYVQRARAINPGYFEVDRVEAFIASTSGDTTGAVTRYKAALSQCESQDERARVSFFLAGHLARNGHDMEAALPLAEFAHEVLQNNDTAMALGNFYVWEHKFAEGQELLEQALDTPSPTLRRIISTSLVDSWRRWAEQDLVDKLPESAFEKGLSGFYVGRPLLIEGVHDLKLIDAMARSLAMAYRAARLLSDLSEVQATRAQGAIAQVLKDGRFRIVESWERIVRAVDALPDHIRRQIVPDAWADSLAARREAVRKDNGEQRLVGLVFGLKERFGFISHPNFPLNLFFHLGSLTTPSDRAHLAVGVAVEFTPSVDGDGRNRAEKVTVIQ